LPTSSTTRHRHHRRSDVRLKRHNIVDRHVALFYRRHIIAKIYITVVIIDIVVNTLSSPHNIVHMMDIEDTTTMPSDISTARHDDGMTASTTPMTALTASDG
jgi:hypothetical protein